MYITYYQKLHIAKFVIIQHQAFDSLLPYHNIPKNSVGPTSLLSCRKTRFIIASFVAYSLGHDVVGCYQDYSIRAIPTLEGKDSILDRSYKYRVNPIAKCAVAAIRAGYSMFAVQNGGWCAASATAPQTFDKYGKSTACKADGEGGAWANQVYTIKGN